MTLDRPILLTVALLLTGLALIYAPLLDQRMHERDAQLLHDLAPDAGFDLRTVRVELGRIREGAWTPLKFLDLRLDAHLFGTDSPTPYLLVNLFLHGLNALLLLTLLGRLSVGSGTSGAIALAFACHPVQVETVATLAGRGELLASTLVLLGLLLHTSKRSAATREAGTLTCFAAGLAASPVAVLLPAFVILVDLGPRRVLPDREFWLSRLPLVVAGVLAVVFLATISRGYDRVFAASLPLADEVHQLGSAFLLSLTDLVAPYSLAAMHTPPPVVERWIPTVVIPLLLVAFAAATRGHRVARAGAICLFLILVAAALRGRLGVQYRADTWLYLAVIALTWTLVARTPQPHRVTRVAALGILGLWALLAHAQVEHWRDDATLVERTFELAPSNWWARTMRADALNSAGDPAAAETEALAALGTQPNAAAAVVALADARRAQGDPDAALRLYERSLLTHWGDRYGARDLGLLLLDTGYADASVGLLERAGSDAGLALAQARLGDADRAKRHRDAALAGGSLSLGERLALAWLLATAPEPGLRDPERALEIAGEIPGEEQPARRLDVEAAARAALGQSADAFRLAQEAARHAEVSNQFRYAERIRDRALVYLRSESWTESRGSAPPADTEVNR